MLFFQMIARRHERASTVLTSNKSFEEWGEVFGDDVFEPLRDLAFYWRSSGGAATLGCGVADHVGRCQPGRVGPPTRTFSRDHPLGSPGPSALNRTPPNDDFSS
jgi:hypothetical protein